MSIKNSESQQAILSRENKATISSVQEESRIIAIGASAGGLEALKDFFDNVPPDCMHSFVVIQHLSPDYKSMMAELLAKNSALPIYEIKNGMKITPGCIYLIPPKKNMILSKGKLKLTDKPEGHHLNLPIDIFFRSIASECKERSICIVLSGTGSDGTSGARSIKEVGGMVMVQDPQQAKFDGMPQSAINTGLVDYVLPVEQLPAELLYYLDHPQKNGASENQIEKDEERVNQILHQIRNVTKLDFQHYKRPTLIRRISRRLSVNKFYLLQDYLDYLYKNPKEAHILAREFLIGVTKFFRDSFVWDSLELRILPELIKSKKTNQILKIWCVGTSSGEEAYSMAISVFEEMERQNKSLDVKIFATDLENNHLEIGSKGLYPESIIADVSKERLNKFFTRRGDEYQISNLIRRMVIFSQHNVLKDPPFNKMDIVVCRNMLIYMQPKAQRKVIGLLHYALNSNGILLLGTSETIGDYKNVLQEVERKGKIFRNIKPARSIGMEPLNYPDVQKLTLATVIGNSKLKIENQMIELLNETILDQLGLSGVYIDKNYNILHAVGEFRKFIQLPEKGFSVNLLKMLPDSTSVSVGSAVRKAFSSKERVLYKDIKIRREDKTIVLDLLINPYETNAISNAHDCLLLFIPKEEHIGKAKIIKQEAGSGNLRVRELEDELRETRDNLQTVVEEVETNSEELQATNEELLSANEELQSTNEELQSVNEELHTVNAELQQKIEDLASLNADMDNLLQSTDIGTIFLDREMRIRKFTPTIKDHFNLRNSDIDRPISHFSSSFGAEIDTFKRIQVVLDTGVPSQREIQLLDGSWFLKRITPYHNGNKVIDGAVLSFVDITELKRSEAIIRESEERFRALYDNAPDMFASFSPQRRIITCNNRMIKELGYDEVSELIGMHVSELYANANGALVKERLDVFEESGKLINAPRDIKRKDGSIISVSVNSEMLYDDEGNELYAITSLRDITDLKKAEKKYLDQNAVFKQVLEGTMAGYWDWMIQEKTEYISPGFKKMVGYKEDEIKNTPESWQKIIHPDDLPIVQEILKKHVDTKGKFPYESKVRYFHKDGSIVWVYSKGKVIEWDKNGAPVRMVRSHADVTPFKNIEEELYRSNSELEEFAYIASHDLQEPLNTIKDFASLFEKEYKGKLGKEADQYLEFIVQATERMKSLVKAVLSYSRIGKGKELVSIDCNLLVNRVEADLRARLEETNTKIHIEELPIIKGYRTELHSLFHNLITNAIKYRKKDVNPKIWITWERDDKYWKFSVRDNGIGIEEKNKERVFNIFQRLNNMNSYEGTGIGLAQSKKIVEIHNGSIWVDSVYGEGSTFSFRIKNFDK